MIKIHDVGISPECEAALRVYQAQVNGAKDFVRQVALAKTKFGAANTKTNLTFLEVRKQLSAMCSGARRCMYCEDSVADEVEHHHPKNHFPGFCFVWGNYLYACGPCNGPKNNSFAIFNEANEVHHLTSKRGEEPKAPPAGTSLLIDPRVEDPFTFLLLDVVTTFLFTPMPTLHGLDVERARYTLELLKLNKRDYLIAAREEAFESYAARLSDYSAKRRAGDIGRAERIKRAILNMQHPTVFFEMLRQYKRLPEVARLVEHHPEILTWQRS